MKRFVLVLFLLAGLGARGQSSGLGAGAAAPPVGLEYTWFGPAEALPPGADALAAVVGKPVVIEFWTTWCAPCIAAMPHLTRLASEFGDRVQFISISNEDTATINRFLRKRRPAGWVGTDTDNSVLGPYGIAAFPTTVLLNADHSIAGLTHPDKLTPSSIRALIEGRWAAAEDTEEAPTVPASTPARDSTAAQAPSKTLPPVLESLRLLRASAPTPHVRLTPATMKGASIEMSKPETGLLFLSQATAAEAYALAYSIGAQNVEGPKKLRKTQWQVAAHVGSEELLLTLLRQALDSALSVQSVVAEGNVQSYVARRVPGTQATGLTAANQPGGAARAPSEFVTVSNGDGEAVARNAPLAHLLSLLTEELETPVADDTGLTGLWDWDLSWDEDAGHSGLLKAVREQLGIELVAKKTTGRVVRLLPKYSK